MKSLDSKSWKEFKLFGDSGLYSLNATNSGVDGIRLKSGDNKHLPYITRSNINNGISKFVDDSNNSFGINKGNCITIGLDTQTVFWQPNDFITGQNIQIVTGEELTNNTAQFMIPLIHKQIEKFNWGGNGATLGRLLKTKAMFPVNNNDDIDYKYINNYIHNLRTSKLSQYVDYAKKKVDDLGDIVEIPSLKETKWNPFLIEDIFTISSGKRLTNTEKTPGSTPFIGATDNKNGLTGFVGNINSSLDHNVLGVNYNGNGMVIGFYHPYECVFTDDVKRFHLKNHDDNAFVLLFMKVAILQQKSKFGYLYKFNAKRMARTSIMLPVKSDDSPDYDYMEQYAKNMMIRKYRQYLNYRKNSEQYTDSD